MTAILELYKRAESLNCTDLDHFVSPRLRELRPYAPNQGAAKPQLVEGDGRSVGIEPQTFYRVKVDLSLINR